MVRYLSSLDQLGVEQEQLGHITLVPHFVIVDPDGPICVSHNLKYFNLPPSFPSPPSFSYIHLNFNLSSLSSILSKCLRVSKPVTPSPRTSCSREFYPSMKASDPTNKPKATSPGLRRLVPSPLAVSPSTTTPPRSGPTRRSSFSPFPVRDRSFKNFQCFPHIPLSVSLCISVSFCLQGSHADRHLAL